MQAKPRKLLHVSFVVPDTGGLWELLRALEASKAGNVEVRPFVRADATTALVARNVPDSAVEVLEAPKRDSRYGNGRTMQRVLRAMKPGERVRPVQIRDRTGLAAQQVNQAMWNLARQGVLERPGMGLYVLVTRP